MRPLGRECAAPTTSCLRNLLDVTHSRVCRPSFGVVAAVRVVSSWKSVTFLDNAYYQFFRFFFHEAFYILLSKRSFTSFWSGSLKTNSRPASRNL